MNHSGDTITNLIEMAYRDTGVCGHCFGYGEAAEQLPWPAMDYKMVPCPHCPAGLALIQELLP